MDQPDYKLCELMGANSRATGNSRITFIFNVFNGFQ